MFLTIFNFSSVQTLVVPLSMLVYTHRFPTQRSILSVVRRVTRFLVQVPICAKTHNAFRTPRLSGHPLVVPSCQHHFKVPALLLSPTRILRNERIATLATLHALPTNVGTNLVPLPLVNAQFTLPM
jgi:hypothetical protein